MRASSPFSLGMEAEHVGLSDIEGQDEKYIAEDMRERWETIDHPVVHKIQDINESVFKETDAAMSFKEVRRRDPYFSLPDLVYDVQEIVKPVLKAYNQGETEELEKYCSPEIVERCKAQHKICDMQGTFYDNKILHISEVEVSEIKMMGDTPLIIAEFQTQQVSNSRNGDFGCYIQTKALLKL
ncbi:mitochondrial import inner membrane translocase subunit TIM44-2 [Tanacetum coccineum]